MLNWWLDEKTTAGAEHLDSAYVAGYDAKAQFDPSADIRALQELGLDESSNLVDLGAGTGTFAVAAAQLGASVVAVDVSPEMVAVLERRSAVLSAGTLTVVQSGFLSYRHRGAAADFVFSRNALHQLPDFWKVIALRQIAGMLRPGGVLRLTDLVFELEPDGIEDAIDGWIDSAGDDPARSYTASDFADHLRSEFSTFTWLLEPMLTRAGFDVIGREVRRSIYATYTCRKAR